MNKKNSPSKTKPQVNPTKSANINLPPRFVVEDGFKSIYANFVVTAFSPFDVSLVIGEAVGGDDEGRQVVHQKVRVTMAPAEAKVVMLILANTLRIFEEQFGEVKIPESQVPAELRANVANQR